MGNFLKSILPIAAGAAGSMFGGPIGGQLAGGLASSLLGGKGSKKSSQQAFADVLRAARPDQANAQGDQLTWTTDPKTGQAVQTTKYSPERQAQFDAFNRIATGRMGKAEGMTAGLPTGAVDYEKMGLGSLANAFGIGEGKTGKRPWADREFSSLGGDALNFLQFAEGNGTATPSQTWGSQPIPTQGMNTGGGSALSPPPPQGGPPPPGPAPSGGGGMIGGMIGDMMLRVPPGQDGMAKAKQAMMEEEARKRAMDAGSGGGAMLQPGMGMPGDRGY
jgi:hypothetical protein